ncbi:unnamed protein product, partial [Mesorhabditis belari]|uniref:Uncharacterized protein n=1 Tax=Mesorhabditis belari TaxID=2138241 RepID=A0AAF3F9D7_9BILA
MYFYFCNSLCFLRCLFFVIFGIFLLRVYHFYSSAFERLHKQENATLFLNWTQVNIEKPPLFLDEASARTRLNELLASPTSKCTRADAQKASHGLTFHPCPAQRNDLCLLISSSNTFGSFINYLNCLKWVIFVPFGSDIVDGMRGEIEVNYLMKFDEWTSWDLSEIENPLIGTNFSATLLNLDSPKGNRKLNSETLPKTFTKITSLLSTRSLYVNFRLPKSGIGVVNEYYDWVLGNFYERNLALIGAST